MTEDMTLASQVEAILFVADRPLALETIAVAVMAPIPDVRGALDSLKSEYDGKVGTNIADEGRVHGFELREVGGGYRLFVREAYADAVRALLVDDGPTKLSQAALETLAVVAYKQPITRRQIASIRAVNVDSVVRTLVSRGFIAEAYTDAETGALYYETTDELLTKLGLNSLDELPPISPLLPDIDEAEDILG